MGGCRTDSTFEFKADGSVRTEIIVEDDTGSMRTLKGNCDNLKRYFAGFGRFAEKLLWRTLRCREAISVQSDLERAP